MKKWNWHFVLVWFAGVPVMWALLTMPLWATELPDRRITTTPTVTQAQATVATKAIWNAAQLDCYKELNEEIENAAVSDSVKYNLVKDIALKLFQGGVTKLWNDASETLRKAMGRAAADVAETEAARLEAQALRLRKWAQVIDKYSE